MTQSRITLPGLGIVNANGHGFAASHDDHQFFTARNSGIYQVALQQDIVLGDDGNDDHRVFRSLGFMDRDRIGRHDFIQITEVINNLATVNGHGHLPAVAVNGRNPSDITVENVFVIVVSNLHDLVVDPVGAFPPGDAVLPRIERRLQLLVQVAGAD